MPKYLFCASYTAEGARGLQKEGGSSRRVMAEEMIGGLGGKVECMYYAFGDTDLYVIADLPDEAAAAAISLTTAASGAVRARTIPLISPEEVDEAAKRSVAYRPPGK